MSAQHTHLVLDTKNYRVPNPNEDAGIDRHFDLKISQRQFRDEARDAVPSKDYSIYVCVELPSRTWWGTTFVSVNLDQFYAPEKRKHIKHRVLLKLESYRVIPPVIFIELTVQKARKRPLAPGTSWRFIEQKDRVQGRPLKPVEGEVLEDGLIKLEPLGEVENPEPEPRRPIKKPEPEPEPGRPIKRRNALREVLSVLAEFGREMVGLEPVKPDPPQLLARRRTTLILMGLESSEYRQRRL